MDEWGYSGGMGQQWWTNEGIAGEWDNNGDRKHCRIYQEMFYFFNAIGMCFLLWSWWISHGGWYYEKYFKMTFWITIFRIPDTMIPFIFHHNNAPVHTTRNVQTWLDDQVIQWPAQSPDLNMIENVWSMFQNRVTRDRPSTKLELIQCLFRRWRDITLDYLYKLFRSDEIRMLSDHVVNQLNIYYILSSTFK